LRYIEIVATVDGEIVGVAAEPRWGGRIPVDDNTALTRDATLVGCADDAPLGPGSYDLYAQGLLLPGVGDLRFVTDPAPVEVVPAGGVTATAEPTDEPSDLPTRGADEPSDDCSAASLRSDTVPGFPGLPGPAAETATTLLAAALDCDAEPLIALNEEDGTSTNFGGRTPEEFWTLPGAEEHQDVYANLAVLLTRVDFAEVPGSEETQPMYVWPRLQAGENSDAAWQEVVDVGLVTQEQADQMRAGEGYLGPRLGIAEDGTWMFFIAGD
jgi:hypothetical protein